jgi:hypothetical protein
MAGVLVEIQSDPNRLALARELGTKRMLSDWNYESQFEKVLIEIETPTQSQRLHLR